MSSILGSQTPNLLVEWTSELSQLESKITLFVLCYSNQANNMKVKENGSNHKIQAFQLFDSLKKNASII